MPRTLTTNIKEMNFFHLGFPKSNSSSFLILSLIPGNIFLIIFSWRAMFEVKGSHFFSFFDDALISMSYGRTLAEGYGLTWYPGAPHVQGFTNPLWTLLFAGLHTLHNSIFMVGLSYLLVNLALINVTAYLIWSLLRFSLPRDNYANWIPALVASTLPFQYSFIYWTLRGMEVGFLGFCLILMIISTVKLRESGAKAPIRKYWSFWIVAAVLGVFTRMDFLLFATLNLIMLRPTKLSFSTNRSKLYQVLATGSVLTSALIVVLSQKFYYGDFLPNTYTLKMTGFSTIERISRGSAVILKTYSAPSIIILAAIASVFRIRSKDKPLEVVRIISLNSLLAITYSIWVGGDAWEGIGKINRYLSVTQPILICLIAILLRKFVKHSKFLQMFCLVLIIGSGLTFGLGINPFRYSWIKSLPLVATYILLGLLIILSKQRSFLRPLSFLLTLVLLTNVVALSLWIKRGGSEFLDREDRNMYLLGADIGNLLKPQGKVAVLWAGAPIYYSKRAGIDLLGKNDKFVAQQDPVRNLESGVWNSTFYPGHNKWNYDYSIGVLKPDMIAQYWGEISDSKFFAWGYKKCTFQDSEYWLLSKSSQINWHQLRGCAGNL
jgi:hypothetical protein